MCGISGAFVKNKQYSEQAKTLVESIVNDQIPRGPDNQSLVFDNNTTNTVILGHNRLSVLDLSINANQPLWDRNKVHCLCYNGEIYNYLEIKKELQQLNYHFSSTSDSEVLLYALIEWGSQALDKLNGMFAFAFWNNNTQQLMLARDRFGIKPLYYYQNNDGLFFASSSTVLAKYFNLKPNLDYLQRGLQNWCFEDDSEICAYENMSLLPASNYCYVSSNNNSLNIKIKRYYNFMQHVDSLKEQLACYDETSLSQHFTELLTNSIDIRLRSDVDIGISLSGGLDSTTIAALALNQGANLTGFCFGNPNDMQTEGHLAQKFSNEYGITTHYICPDNDELLKGFWQTITAQDAPFGGLSIVAQNLVFQKANQFGFKVMLGGQGADEGLMGYRKFMVFYWLSLLNHSRYLHAAQMTWYLARMTWAELPRLSNYYLAMKRYFVKSSSNGSIIDFSGGGEFVSFSPIKKSIEQKQQHDILRHSLPTLLRYEDRNSMSHSIETRLPFMDYRLMAYNVALPVGVKLRKGYGKWLLRQTTSSIVPDEIRLARYKRGFDTNAKMWVNAGLGEQVRDYLMDNINACQLATKSNLNVTKTFSDNQLITNSNKMRDAITLCWLVNKI